MNKKIRTTPDLSETSAAHKEAIVQGDTHYKGWSQNVIATLKGKSDEEIKYILQASANPFAVCFEHWIGDFNMASGIRNANAFNAREVFYLGDKRWDKRGAVGVYNYTEVQWIPTIEEFKKLKDKYVIVGIDNVSGAIPLDNYNWKHNSLMVFGEEGVGLTPKMQSFCEEMVYIEQFGSVRSLNVGTASGIVMHDFVRKFRKTV